MLQKVKLWNKRRLNEEDIVGDGPQFGCARGTAWLNSLATTKTTTTIPAVVDN
jgi:hypothetical protein